MAVTVRASCVPSPNASPRVGICSAVLARPAAALASRFERRPFSRNTSVGDSDLPSSSNCRERVATARSTWSQNPTTSRRAAVTSPSCSFAVHRVDVGAGEELECFDRSLHPVVGEGHIVPSFHMMCPGGDVGTHKCTPNTRANQADSVSTSCSVRKRCASPVPISR